jgi:dipeptidyl aminopeptidase/acylaminoacyl peptidase
LPAKRRLTAEDLYALQLVEDPQLSPNGQHLAFVKVTHDKVGNQYRRHIWLTTVNGDTPRTRQFTFGPKSDTTPRWSPDGQTLAFVSARGDKPQIHLISLAGGEARPLTAHRNGASNPVWSTDGRRLAFVAPVNAGERQAEDEGREDPPPADSLEARHRKEAAEHKEKLKADPRIITRLPYRTGTEYMDDRFTHLYVIEVLANGEAPKPQRLTDGDQSFSEITWAGDGRAVFSTQSLDPEHEPFFKAALVRIPLPARGARRPRRLEYLTGAEYEYFLPRVSPDGQWIAALRRREQAGLLGHVAQVVVLPATGRRQAAERAARDLAAPLDRTVDSFQWSYDSRHIYFQAQDQGAVGVYRARVEGPAEIEHVVRGPRTVTGFSVDAAGNLAYTASTAARPVDLYYAGAGRQAERQVTDFNRKLLSELELGRVEEVRYHAPDGRPIQGWLFKPAGFKAGQRCPLAVHLHGGPHLMWGASTPGMWLEWQLHAARGYAVFFCNPRGATGYGEAFADAIHNDWGDHVMHDILAGVDVVVGRGFIDPERLVITGGSYAGYMTAWIVAHDHRFACAWTQRGLYSLLSFFGTTDIPQLIEREFDMLPFDDIEKAWAQSPLAYVRSIRTPLAIEHQDQDYRCPVSEAEQLYAALKRLKREVVLYRYPREGHEMSRGGEPRHRVDRLNRMVDWFDRHTQREQ